MLFGFQRFDQAMRDLWNVIQVVLGSLGGLLGVVSVILVGLVVLSVAWLATAAMEALWKAMSRRYGWTGRGLYILVLVPIYIILVIRTEVAMSLTLIPQIETWAAIIFVALVNIAAMWWHSKNPGLFPMWVLHTYWRINPRRGNVNANAETWDRVGPGGVTVNKLIPGEQVTILGSEGEMLRIGPHEWVWKGFVSRDGKEEVNL